MSKSQNNILEQIAHHALGMIYQYRLYSDVRSWFSYCDDEINFGILKILVQENLKKLT